MPYIPDDERRLFQGHDAPEGTSTGQLNYMLTQIVDGWLSPKLSYDRINSAIGVLESMKLELYRRVAAPYENQKRLSNGDAYMERDL